MASRASDLRDETGRAGSPTGDGPARAPVPNAPGRRPDRLWEVEVVIEAVLDRWPDRDLDARIESADGLGEQVCGRMPKDIERVRVVLVPRRQDLDLLAVSERLPQVLNLAVRANQNRL